jgi:PhnB protein
VNSLWRQHLAGSFVFLDRKRAGRMPALRKPGSRFYSRRKEIRMSSAPGNAKELNAVIAPLLSVRHGKKAVEFYKTAFGATELFLIENDKGEVVARLSVGGAEFWVADESPEHKNFSPETLGGGTTRMLLMVGDPDALFRQAVAAGATLVSPVGNSHGWRMGRVVDPFGHHWEICKELS